jgi:hypothetical protein
MTYLASGLITNCSNGGLISTTYLTGDYYAAQSNRLTTGPTYDYYPVSTTTTAYWIADAATATMQVAGALSANFPTIVAQDNSVRSERCSVAISVPVEATWTAWNECYRPPPQIFVPTLRPPRLNEAELARREAVEREGREIRQRELQEARATARTTLLSLLDGRQKEMLAREAAFELRVDDRIYRIRPGNTVQQIEPGSGRVLCAFCIHPYAEGWIPEDDFAIAQKLLLEADEGEFLRLANRRVA